MEQFYANYLQKGMTKIEALRQAQLYVLNNPDTVRGLDIDFSLGSDAFNRFNFRHFLVLLFANGVAVYC